MGTKLVGLFAFVGLVALVGCSSGGGGSSGAAPGPDSGDIMELAEGEQPLVGTNGVKFEEKEGELPEFWEAITHENETYLKYNRFPFGATSYKKQPIFICTAIVGDKKYFGLSEQRIRVKKAVFSFAAMDNGGKKFPKAVPCQNYADMVAAHPELKSIRKIFESIN